MPSIASNSHVLRSKIIQFAPEILRETGWKLITIVNYISFRIYLSSARATVRFIINKLGYFND